MPLTRIPALLVTGATGAGKTTYLSRLLATRPAVARWAVLVNDFGEARLDAGGRSSDSPVYVREVAGCICCSAQVSLRTAIIGLLREAQPERLLIEASAAAHPASIVKVLREKGIASAVALERTVCIVDHAQLTDPRYAGAELYREQLIVADAVALTRTGAKNADEYDAARRALTSMGVSVVEDADEPAAASKLTG